MKAAILTALNRIEIQNVTEPKLQKDTDVLLKITMVGVCGSDVHYYETGRIGSQVIQYPFIVGHECAAQVVEIGKGVTRVKKGDSVVVDPAQWCHHCDQCKVGRDHTCRNLKFLGCPGQCSGCLCEYIVMPQASLFKADNITPEQAVISEPLAIGVYAVQQANLPKNAAITILGAGPIGLSCQLSAMAEGVKDICVSDKLDYRINAASANGALLAANPQKDDIVKKFLAAYPLGFDVVFECAGQQEAMDQAITLLKPGGKLVIVGIPRNEMVHFNIDFLRRKEITIVNVRRQNQCTQKAIDLLSSRKINADFMVTHHFPLEQSKKAFDIVAGYKDGAIKAMITM
jgi:L-iditol 2-dehydrogenase